MNEKLSTKEISSAHRVSEHQARRIAASGDWRGYRRSEEEPKTKAETCRDLFKSHLARACQLRTAFQRCWQSQKEIVDFVTDELSEEEIVEFLGPASVGKSFGDSIAALLATSRALGKHLPALAEFDKAKRLSGCPYSAATESGTKGK